MQLIVFAHYKEAVSFIENLSYTKDTYPNLFKNDSSYLYICGEGYLDLLLHLPTIIDSNNITEVINFGVAGALEELELDKVYSVRTAYAHGEKPFFHSYTLDEQGFDCITHESRVLENTTATKLSNFASMVDRELWGIAKVCKLKKIPLKSYKLISDIAGDSTKCFDVQNLAKEYSDKLYEFYKSIEPSNNIQTPEAFDLPFHASFTQTKQVEKLSKKLNLNFPDLLSEISNKNITTANSLIIFLKERINPLEASIQTKIDSIEAPFKEIGAKLHFDHKKECKKVNLTMEINSQSNIDNLRKALEKFDYKEVEDFYNGNLDV